MKKNKLRVVIADNSEPENLLKFLGELFDVELLKPKAGKFSSNSIDLIIFTDGETINPESLGLKRISKIENFNNNRDNIEIDSYYNYAKSSVLKLGIGRGAQMLSHFLGAKNIQYVEGHNEVHNITIDGYGSYTVESNHIQMMYPFNMNENYYQILGWSKNFRSKTYLNTLEKEIPIKPEFLEAEIVKYNKTLCFQFCPENTTGELKHTCLNLIQRFINDNGKIQKPEFEQEFEVERSTNGLGSISNQGGRKTSSYYAMPKFQIGNEIVESVSNKRNTYDSIGMDFDSYRSTRIGSNSPTPVSEEEVAKWKWSTEMINDIVQSAKTNLTKQNKEVNSEFDELP